MPALTGLVKQQVLRLDVSVNHIQTVKVLQRPHQLEDVPRRYCLSETPPRLRLHGAVQLSLPRVLHHDENPGTRRGKHDEINYRG